MKYVVSSSCPALFSSISITSILETDLAFYLSFAGYIPRHGRCCFSPPSLESLRLPYLSYLNPPLFWHRPGFVSIIITNRVKSPLEACRSVHRVPNGGRLNEGRCMAIATILAQNSLALFLLHPRYRKLSTPTSWGLSLRSPLVIRLKYSRTMRLSLLCKVSMPLIHVLYAQVSVNDSMHAVNVTVIRLTSSMYRFSPPTWCYMYYPLQT